MGYGIIEYDQNGNPICEICRKSFKRVLSHVRQKHYISEKEYKKSFGFDLKRGICSKESSRISKLRVFENFEKCVQKNLVEKGNKTRFKKGDAGRTKDKVSEQTRKRLKNRLKEPYMVKAMKKAGHKLGKSGIGNAKRWNKQILK